MLSTVPPRTTTKDLRPTPAPGGRLTIYSATERRFCEPLLRGFCKDHPDVEFDFVFGISTDLHRRHLRDFESGGATASLLWSSAMDLQMTLVLDGHAQPHGLHLALPREAAYRDLAVATTCEPLVTLSRDPTAPAGTPGEIAALILRNPDRWRGRIAVLDIERNGLGFLAMLQWSFGEPEFEDFLEALKWAAPRMAANAPALIGALTEGADLAPHVLGLYASEAVTADPRLHVASSAAPPLAVSRIAFIPRRAANPQAASLFLGYMLCPSGQAALAEGGLIPITSRANVRAIALDDAFARFIDPETRRRLLARWRAAVGRPDVNAGGSSP